ncbi:hypothetical protein PENTCL1PPCAC_5839 [Pristionchus entomophagus]|uniref:Uncharacterized protein n=1 Tax=Pristionchus entomophagus TaxID=358040 RepID=A0AAV5STZ6_9BILA|nr:hypothetical protein PENTCL1PPCAC_5839 [Pristionchus entomophagus]
MRGRKIEKRGRVGMVLGVPPRWEGGSTVAVENRSIERSNYLTADDVKEALHLDLLLEICCRRNGATLAASVEQAGTHIADLLEVVGRPAGGGALPDCCQLPEVVGQLGEDLGGRRDVALVVGRSLHARHGIGVEVEELLQLLGRRDLTLGARRRLRDGRQQTRGYGDEERDTR